MTKIGSTALWTLVAAHLSFGFTGRIAATADGNSHDIDDWAATPGVCALIAAAGLQSRLVHFDFCSHIAGSDNDQGDKMAANALEAATRFGLNKSVFYNDMKDLGGSVANIAKVVNASSSTDPLTFIMCGPPEVRWRGLNAADASKRQYVTVISHSSWNNNPHDTKDHPTMPHVAADVKALGVKWVQISDQNRSPWVESSMAPYDWMKSAGSNLSWLHGKIKQVADGYYTYQVPYRPDWSDAGMMYYAITGLDKTTMAALKDFLTKSVDPTDPTDPPDPTVIISPTTGTDLVEGVTVTLKGSGTNLVWYYEANSDGAGNIEIGRGATVTFKVPTTINAPKTLQLILRGDGGEATTDHQIVGGSTGLTVPQRTWMATGNAVDLSRFGGACYLLSGARAPAAAVPTATMNAASPGALVVEGLSGRFR